MLRALALSAPLFLWGCMGATNQQLTRRAAFDLDCPESRIEVVEIDKRTRGVRGCGQRGTYVSQCKPCANGYVGCECTWILNTDGRREQAGRASR
jgi:hypothetical protein